MNKVAIIIISLILAMAVGLSGCVTINPPGAEAPPEATQGSAPEVPYREQLFTVEPGYLVNKPIAMGTGALCEGYFLVTGGNNDIRFMIKDRYDNEVLNIKVENRHDFSYRTPSKGPHLITLCFDNSFSLITSKQVHLYWRSVVQVK